MLRSIETILSLGLCALALASTSVHGQAKNPLVGAWKVTEIANPGSPPLSNPQGGLYVFTQKPAYPSNDVATDADKVAVFNMLYLNAGGYTVSGNMLTLSPTIAKSAFAMEPGRTIQYEFTVNGDTLTLFQKPNGPGL